jgi:hypothetical protein
VTKFIRIGVDLAKNYFQVHALVSDVSPAVTRKLRRSKMHEFFSQDMMKGCDTMGGDMTRVTQMMSTMREKLSHAGNRVAAALRADLKSVFSLLLGGKPDWAHVVAPCLHT